MENLHRYDFAISYASPDSAFVEEVVRALKTRGLRVFFAPDEQSDIVGRNLLDYLHEVYLSKARYCLIFISEHYAQRKWTNRVERPAAQERALNQEERYIIPIRLDDTPITALSGNTADIRNSTPKQIADLCVAVMLRDENPVAMTPNTEGRDHLVLRVTSFTEFDVDLLRQSFRNFAGWAAGNAHMIPVEVRLPKFLVETIHSYAEILDSKEFEKLEQTYPGTRESFGHVVKMAREEFGAEILRVPALVLFASQPNNTPAMELTDQAVELIRSYVLSKVVALARCLISAQLRGFQRPSWATSFADCDALWNLGLMGGLPWLYRAEGSERFLWFDADVTSWGEGVSFSRVRIYRPSVMVVKPHREKPTAEQVIKFIAPQLLQWELDNRLPKLLNNAMNYPDRIGITYRNENVIEANHFSEVALTGYGWQRAQPAMDALKESILSQPRHTREDVAKALTLMHAAEFAFGDHKDLLRPGLTQLFEELRNSKSTDASNDQIT